MLDFEIVIVETDTEFLEKLELVIKAIFQHLDNVLFELDDLGDKLLQNKLTLKEFTRLDKIKSVLNQTKALMESLDD